MKQKNYSKQSYKTEEQKEMIRFLIVLGAVVILVVAVYFVSKKLVVDKSLYEISYETGKVNYERAIVGTIFNRPESEYYIMIYDESKEDAVYYSSLSSKYVEKQEGALKVYHIDLGSEINKK